MPAGILHESWKICYQDIQNDLSDFSKTVLGETQNFEWHACFQAG